MKEVNETSIKEATRFEIILRDFKNWRRDKIIQTYEYINSPDMKEKIQSLKDFLRINKQNLGEGIVKYKKMAFWWHSNNNSYFSSTRIEKFWNLRKAQKQGVFDFYMRTIMIVGGFTILIGVWRGRKKGKKS